MLRPGDRHAHVRWEDQLKAIRNATPVDRHEDAFDREKRKKELTQDFEAFCAYYFPHLCLSPFADFHKKQVRKVLDNQRGVFVWVLARAQAKSVVNGILLPLFLMVRGEARTVLMASWNEGNAVFLLSDLRAELEANQRFNADWGPFQGSAKWEAGEFVTRDGVYFGAIGSGQSPRGLRNGNCRPDLIIVDDFDEDEQSRNPARVDAAEEWLFGALFGAMDITGRGRFVMVGNIIAEDTVLARAVPRADHHMQVNLLDKDGQPSWHQRFTLAECQSMIDKMGYNLAQREYFNNPIRAGKVFKKDWIQYKKLPRLNAYRAIVAYLDPGFKKTATSDSKAWILVGIREGEYHIIRAFVGVASISEMIAWGYDLNDYVSKKGGAVQLYMEQVFLQDLLFKDFAEEGKKRGAPLPLRGDTRKKPDKDARIESISGYFERSAVWFNEEFQNEHHMKALVSQLLNFQPGVKTYKDGPDALEGAIHILQGAITGGANIHIGQRHKSKHRV
ncbi:MAG: hypothetical protein ABI432_08630 [Flavobacteriales bacterium]